MIPHPPALLKQLAVLVLVTAAAWFAWTALTRVRQSGEDGAKVWFYDESERRLYPVPKDTIPPHPGIGGHRGDGVRALLVVSRQDQRDTTKRRIAYLETYTPALKKVLDDVRVARAAHRRYDGTLPDRESAFVQTNTLVRRPTESTWHPSSSDEGQRIVSEWHTWRGPDGEPLLISVP